jgi:hypothetical protein
MSNPFDQNPWQNSQQQEGGGPRYGNAYESNSNPPYGNAYEQPSSYTPQQQNSDTISPFSATGYNNAWSRGESNKTEYNNNDNFNSVSPQPQHQQDAYQYTGTRYGNQAYQSGAYSAAPPAEQETYQQSPQPTNNSKPNNESVGPDVWNGEIYHTPNKWRFWLRFVMFLASIGHLGFAAGARPVKYYIMALWLCDLSK